MTRQILTEKIDHCGGERYTVVTGTELDHEIEGAFYDKAEAQLHLAAPCMLEALEDALAAYERDDELDFQQIRRTIARARGQA